MDIDKVISDFDSDKFKSDCFIHTSLQTYMKKKSQLSSCGEIIIPYAQYQNKRNQGYQDHAGKNYLF